MDAAERQAWAALPLVLGIGAVVAWAGSHGGLRVGSLPLFALCALVAFGVNWAVFAPSFLARTERYFDLTGSLTYLSLVGLSLALGEPGARAWLLGGLVTIWAARLGSFLFVRIHRDGTDRRFDAIKQSFPRFLMTWTLQGLWVLLTMACALAVMTSGRQEPLGLLAWIGLAIWGLGFAVEVTADRQKSRFRADPANRDRFIQSGLWAWSRHPNYFGEITLWLGVALIALPGLSGWQHLTLVSPVFVTVLLTRISGIPMLEARADKKWGEQPDYRSYRDRTPALVPRPPRPA